MELCDTGSGDPARWSVTRISHALQDPYYDDHVPLEVALDAPALLRAYVPFVHADSRVRQDLTDEAIATIDQMSLAYKRCLLDNAARHFDDDIYPHRAS